VCPILGHRLSYSGSDRYTTVFGLDDTSQFKETGEAVDAKTGKKAENDKDYSKYPPNPSQNVLTSSESQLTRKLVSNSTYLVNYYGSGANSILYHSDDERFLGSFSAIA